MSLRSGYVGIASLDDFGPSAAAAAARRTRTSLQRSKFDEWPELGGTTLSVRDATLSSSRVRRRVAMEGSESSPKLPSIGRAGAVRDNERAGQPEPHWASSSASALWPPPPKKQHRAVPTTVMDLGWKYSTRIYHVGNTADQYQYEKSVWHARRKPLATAGGGGTSLSKMKKLAAKKSICPWGPNELFKKRDETSEESFRDLPGVRDSRALLEEQAGVAPPALRVLASPSAGKNGDRLGDDQ